MPLIFLSRILGYPIFVFCKAKVRFNVAKIHLSDVNGAVLVLLFILLWHINYNMFKYN